MRNNNYLMKKLCLFITLIGIYCSLSGQNSSVYQYDNLNRLIKIINTENNVVEYQYDEIGNRTLKIGTLTKSLIINLLPEGLFNPLSNQLNKAQNTSGDAFGGNIADSISIELHYSTYPYTKAGNTYRAALMTTGTITLNLPGGFSGEYYVVVKHRNSIETWSANPVAFNTGNTSYDFTLSASQAHGGNLKEINGKYCIYAGDVNQDGVVDAGDLMPVDNDASNFLQGYRTTDVNGDGVVNSSDLTIIHENAANFVKAITP